MVYVPNHIARLIARFMSKKLNAKQTQELDDWIGMNDDNMLMFEKLTDKRNAEWTKKWFREMGIRNDYIESREFTGWYTPERSDPTHYNIWLIIGIIGIILFILLITFFPDIPDIIFDPGNLKKLFN